MKALILLCAVSCGQPPPVVVRLNVATTLAALTKANCPVLPSDVTVLTRLVINGDTQHACPLTFSQVQTTGAYTVSGACTGITTGSVLQLKLQWYALSPTIQEFVLLAESDGTLDTTKEDQAEYDANFNVPKTKALPTDPAAEQDSFNCDRTGVYTCDNNTLPDDSVSSSVDTCSNLEELCTDTLFNATQTNNQCP